MNLQRETGAKGSPWSKLISIQSNSLYLQVEYKALVHSSRVNKFYGASDVSTNPVSSFRLDIKHTFVVLGSVNTMRGKK